MGERSGMGRDTARSQQGLAPARRLGAAFAIDLRPALLCPGRVVMGSTGSSHSQGGEQRARLCGLNMTQRQLKRLEEEGVLVSRLVGNIRLFSFNDRNPTVRNLKELLEAELKLLPNEQVQQYFRERQRPRQSGKALVHHG